MDNVYKGNRRARRRWYVHTNVWVVYVHVGIPVRVFV